MPPKPAEINVIPKAKEVKYDTSQTIAQMQGTATDTIDPYGFHGISQTQGYMSGKIRMVPRVSIDYKHYPEMDAVCLWYDTIDIEIEIDPSIVIAKEVYQDSCMRKSVIEHEMKHIMVDRRIVNKYSKIMGEKVFEGLKQRGFKVGPVRVRDSTQIVDRMRKTVYQIVGHEYKKMELERTEMQRDIDSLEEYKSVDAKCPDFDESRSAYKGK